MLKKKIVNYQVPIYLVKGIVDVISNAWDIPNIFVQIDKFQLWVFRKVTFALNTFQNEIDYWSDKGFKKGLRRNMKHAPLF